MGGTGVTSNAICPGPFATEMNLPLLNDPVKYQEFVKKIPMGRWGELDELAGAVVFLASPASSFITGRVAVRGWRVDRAVGVSPVRCLSCQPRRYAAIIDTLSTSCP